RTLRPQFDVAPRPRLTGQRHPRGTFVRGERLLRGVAVVDLARDHVQFAGAARALVARVGHPHARPQARVEQRLITGTLDAAPADGDRERHVTPPTSRADLSVRGNPNPRTPRPRGCRVRGSGSPRTVPRARSA